MKYDNDNKDNEIKNNKIRCQSGVLQQPAKRLYFTSGLNPIFPEQRDETSPRDSEVG